MNKSVEMYLMQVAKQLRGLPTPQREAELREVESHLRAMIEAREVAGVLYSDAVDESLSQFGSAPRVGRDLTRAWLKQQSEPPLRAGVAALTAVLGQGVVLTFLAPQASATMALFGLLYGILPSRFHGIGRVDALTSPLSLFCVLLFWTVPFLAGRLASAFSPQRGWWIAPLTCIATTGIFSLSYASGYTSVATAAFAHFVALPPLLCGVLLTKVMNTRKAKRVSRLTFAQIA